MTYPIATPPRNAAAILQRYYAYGTGKWWTDRGYGNSIPTLMGWTGTAHSYAQELQVRGLANNAFALAVHLPDNITTARSIVALCRQHISNTAWTGAKWGRNWQSPMWAAHMGLAAMVGWDGIPYEHDRDAVKRVLIDEANYVLQQRAPLFWKNAAGVELRPGDSAAEENSWCAMVLWVASALLPGSPERVAWQARALDLCQSAFAIPGEDERGYNLDENCLVTNHGRIHPDYMTTVSQNFWGVVTQALVGRVSGQADAAIRPAERIYSALQHEPITADGKPAYNLDSPAINFPAVGNDWGARRPAAYAALDGLMDLFEMGVSASYYASIHLADVASMQLRPATATHPVGSFVDTAVTPKESTYPEENTYTASQVAFLALAEKVVR